MIIKYNFLSVLHKNICCRYSLESHRQCDSNEYPQHLFLWKNKQNYSLIITQNSPDLFHLFYHHVQQLKQCIKDHTDTDFLTICVIINTKIHNKRKTYDNLFHLTHQSSHRRHHRPVVGQYIQVCQVSNIGSLRLDSLVEE